MACAHVIDAGPGTTPQNKRGPLELGRRVPRVLLADDREEVLETVSSMLKDECEIVGLAADGEQVLQLAQTRSPDVLILDIFMPGLSGFDVAVRLRESDSLVKILFLTVHEDPEFVDAAISLGVLGYVLKAHLITELMPAIHSILNDHLYVSPTLSSRLSHS
jgi:DNA-binding NarL/FixJ family response regulator